MLKKGREFYQQNSERGQTIIELLIATVVVGTVVTAVAIALTYNIKRNAEIRYRETGATLAQEGLEAMRRERERNSWGGLYDYLNDNTTYCINDLGNGLENLFDESNGCGAGQTLERANTDFQREVVVDKYVDNGNEAINFVVTVKWNLGTDDETSVSTSHTMKERLH